MSKCDSTLGEILGTLGWIDAHLARAVWSSGMIEALFQMGGKEASALVVGPY